MKNNQEILNDLSTDFISSQDEVNYIGKSSVIRAIFWAVANVLVEVWNDVFQTKRKIQVDTAIGSDLDYIAERFNLTRGTATKSSVVLLFNGTSGTVIPIGTQVKNPTSGIIYETKSQLILGTNNSSILRPIMTNQLGDIVIAESIDTGNKTKVSPSELTELVSTIENVTVTNLVPSIGGEETESDEALRDRIKTYPETFSQGTQRFYQSLAKKYDTNILKCNAKYDTLTGGVIIYLVKTNLGTFTQQELTELEVNIYDEQRALNPVKCVNATMRAIDVKFNYTRDANIEQTVIFRDLATQLSELINPLTVDFAGKLYYTDILETALRVNGILTIDLSTFKVNNNTLDIVCGNTELPRLASITITSNTNTIQSQIYQQLISF